MIIGIIGLVGGGGLVAMSGAFGNPEDLWRVIHFGWMTWTGISIGMLGLMLLHHTVRGKWGAPLLRIWEAGGGTGMIIGSLLLWGVFTFLGGAEIVFHHWWTPEARAGDAVLEAKAKYLSKEGFIQWSLIYYAIFLVLSHLMTTWLKKEESTGKKSWSDKRNNLAGPALLFFVLAVNFAYTHWAMSLDAHWYSTIYGVWLLIGGAISAMGIGLWVVGSQAHKKPYAAIMNTDFTRDIGNMTLVFTLFWTYFTLSQYLIIWSGNMPEFTSYYVNRGTEDWFMIASSRVGLQFFLPFIALLFPGLKRSPKGLARVGILVFAMQLVNWFYVLGPSLYPGSSPGDIAMKLGGALLLFGGAWAVAFSMRVTRAPLLTESHPYQVTDDNMISSEEASSHA